MNGARVYQVETPDGNPIARVRVDALGYHCWEIVGADGEIRQGWGGYTTAAAALAGLQRAVAGRRDFAELSANNAVDANQDDGTVDHDRA